MENKTLNLLFGPLDRKYCLLFYILTVLAFVALILFVLSGLYIGISKRRGIEYYFLTLFVAFFYVFNYLQNRLLYSMCVNSM
jgi:hypothetical protein